ncbi:MAG TPA: hypothetical protein VIW29_16930 [Polyangiaceae bacterium]
MSGEPMFRYRKLYTDVVTPSGSVCVGYASWLRCLGYELCSAGYEWYPAGGERRVVRARGKAQVDIGRGEVQLRFQTAGEAFSLTLRAQSEHVEADVQQLTKHLSWQVLLGHARGRAQGVGGEGELLGAGYADYVEMTRPPRALGLQSVEWGRGHVADESFVFTRARFADGRVFGSALSNGRVSDQLELVRSPKEDGDLLLRLAQGSVTLRGQRTLHAGSALDGQRFPGLAERAVARLCSGPVHERRWLAHASFPSGASSLALHEQVRLG